VTEWDRQIPCKNKFLIKILLHKPSEIHTCISF